ARLRQSTLNQTVDVQRRFELASSLELRPRLRSFGHKQRTAIFVRQNGYLVCTYLLRVRNDFGFVKADQRSENRHGRDVIDGHHALQRLASDLSHALSRNQRETVSLTSQAFGNAYHKSAHDGDAKR